MSSTGREKADNDDYNDVIKSYIIEFLTLIS